MAGPPAPPNDEDDTNAAVWTLVLMVTVIGLLAYAVHAEFVSLGQLSEAFISIVGLFFLIALAVTIIYALADEITGRPSNASQSPRDDVIPPASDDFLQSYEWRRLRYKVIRDRGRRCECCGATPADGVAMHVDHIRPRRLFPELALDESNLQVLCEICNHGKGNWDQTDWRNESRSATSSATRH